MVNPFKSIKKAIVKRLGGRREPVQPPDKMYPELEVIWPSGTWKMAGHVNTSRHDWDVQVVHPTILDCWAFEFYADAVKRAGYQLNPGMFGSFPPAIPKGWLPSETTLKALYAKENWDTKYLHYIVAELDNLGHLRP